DTGTRLALKEALVNNAPVSVEVQLQWSVQPADLGKVPPLAIFNAYTLYTVEGSRDGHKWYGLRLGFFSDAISAKQVAHYVRSEFASVAVVPVSPQGLARASAAARRRSRRRSRFSAPASSLSTTAGARRSTTPACGTCASRCRRTRRSRSCSSASASG